MNLIIPNVALDDIAAAHLETEDVYLKLFTNDFTPDYNTVIGDFTEMTGEGYAHKTLDAASWSTSSGVGGVVKSYAKQKFDFTPTTTTIVYGKYMVGVTSGKLKASGKFATPHTIATVDDPITITPEMTFRGITA